MTLKELEKIVNEQKERIGELERRIQELNADSIIDMLTSAGIALRRTAPRRR